MDGALAGCFGFLLGAVVGAALGVGAGILWISVFQTSCFEGYCGMLVSFSFMPMGAFLGGLVGGILLIMPANSGPSATAAASPADTAASSEAHEK